MSFWDWMVIGSYLAAMLAAAVVLGRRQSSRSDYFLGGNDLPSWALATSTIATQCSTNSLLGAPAFVGFVIGGGLVWLQYELAVPLAMLLLCFAFVPLRAAGVISIYSILEQRLGLTSRLLASGCFLLFRGVATGVTVYGVASVVELITGLSFSHSVLVLMGVTIAYDLLGGMRAVVFSDVLQMGLLLLAVVITLIFLADPLWTHWSALSGRTDALLNDWGIQSGNNYGFWPMFFGGLFLYMAYYGCDQSQAQRVLAARSARETQQVLLLNGLLRFPLVLGYCLLGLGLAAYAMEQPQFLSSLPTTDTGEPNLNLVFPAFVEREFPVGLAGLAIVGLFAAAMSSIDSALNSLAASTIEDFVNRFSQLSERGLFYGAKLATLAWGTFAVALSFQVERIAPTVLEAINKVGSMANGPLLGLFCIALLAPGLGQRAAVTGFLSGILGNGLLWLAAPQVSWLWWNLTGFITTTLLAWMLAPRRLLPLALSNLVRPPAALRRKLLAMTLVILTCCALLQWA